jgi:hypothetical protein
VPGSMTVPLTKAILLLGSAIEEEAISVAARRAKEKRSFIGSHS